MLTKDDINNILFFLNSATINGNQAITLAVLQTKLSNMLKVMEVTDPEVEKPKVEEDIKNKE